MAWIKGTATDFREALEHLHDFATKATKAEAPVAGANTGDGTVQGQTSTASSVAETITFTCTTGGASAVFSVSGSVTGALPDLTINTLYSESVISCLITGGDVDFAVSDSFTVVVSAITPLWDAERYVNTPGGEYELILKGYGYSTTDEIFVGMQTYDAGAGSVGWRVNGFTGYIPANDFLEQPGAVVGNTYPWDHHFVPTTSTSVEYWFFVSPQRVLGCILSGAVYSHFYTGWLNQYATPSQWNYPMAVGSTSYNQDLYTSSAIYSFWNTQTADTSVSILDNSSWIPIFQDNDAGLIYIYPLQTTDWQDIKQQSDGTVLELPCVPLISNQENSVVYGQWEGVKMPSPCQGALTPEDLLIGSTLTSIVFQDTSRSNKLASYELMGDL